MPVKTDILAVGSRARELNLMGVAVLEHRLVEELAAIVCIEPD